LGGVSSLPYQALSLGNFRQDSRENVLENRRRFQTALQTKGWELVTANQIHSADVQIILNALDAQSEPKACDALITDIPQILLAVQTADCMPILLADERTGAFAAIHAGWRGTLKRIVSRTLEQMQQTYGTRPAEILAAFGPAISACCFEVGPEVIEEFKETFPDINQVCSNAQPNGKAHLDLRRLNRQLLLEAGVNSDRIFDCALCTACRTDLFFSYRKEQGSKQPIGRLMGVIGRKA
jgi:YfiH family protein